MAFLRKYDNSPASESHISCHNPKLNKNGSVNHFIILCQH